MGLSDNGTNALTGKCFLSHAIIKSHAAKQHFYIPVQTAHYMLRMAATCLPVQCYSVSTSVVMNCIPTSVPWVGMACIMLGRACTTHHVKLRRSAGRV